MMRQGWDSHLAARLAVVLVIILLLGIAPRPHLLTRLFWEAQRAKSSQSYGEAARRLAQAAELVPWRPELWEEAGRLALQGEDPENAIVYLEKCDSLNRLSQEGQAALASAYQQTGNLPAAIQIWEKQLQEIGPQPDLYTYLYQAQRALKNYPAAIEAMQALASLQPADTKLRYQIGLLLATQEPEKAPAHLVQAAELDPSLAPKALALATSIRSGLRNEEPTYRLVAAGRALAAFDEWELAAEAFHQATLARPDYAEAWAFLGEARQHQAENQGGSTPSTNIDSTSQNALVPVNDDGLEELQKAVALNANSLAANSFLALYWQRHQDYNQALKYTQKTVTLESQNPTPRVELGNILAILGDLTGALEAYQSAIELAPQDSTYLKLLILFSIKYEYQLEDVGLPAASAAITQDAQDPEALDLMGQVLFRLDDLLQAEKFFQRAVEIDQKYAPAHLHLGMLFLEKEETQKAFEKINLAASLAPDTPVAEQAQRLLQTYFP